MVDIGSGIQGTFNQAHLASRRAEADKAKDRRGEEDRVRDARKRFIVVQEEVAQAQTLRGRRVEPDKEQSNGRDARDQYETHDELAAEPAQDDRATDPADPEARQAGDTPPEAASGHLIDIEA